MRHCQNKGKGEALNTGFCEARRLQPDVIVVIDADGQHLPEQLPLLVGPVLAGVADIVVGSRYLEKTSQVPPHRLLGHWFFNHLTRLTSGISVSDSQSGYRAFSPRAYNSGWFHCSDFSVEAEMQFLAHEHGLRVMEVPITIRYDEKPKRSVWQQGLNVLNGVLRLTGQYRPLLFFGLTGAVCMVTGLGWNLWVMDHSIFMYDLATIIREVLFITGLIMLSTGLTLHSVRSLLINLLRDQRQAKGGE